MRNRKGEGYIRICVFTVVVCMFLSVFVTMVSAIGLIKQTKRNTSLVLDNFVMTESIEIYNSIKNGNDKTDSIPSENYIESLCGFCTFVQSGKMLYHKDGEGQNDYWLTVPTLQFIVDKELKISASYTIYVPIYFAGIRVDTAEVPIIVISKLNEKF